MNHESNQQASAQRAEPVHQSHASAVLYPAIQAAMAELQKLAPGFSRSVDRAFNHLHAAFWSECPAPASAAPLRPLPDEICAVQATSSGSLARYRSHKVVEAAKIVSIEQAPAKGEAQHAGGDWFLWLDGVGTPVLVGHNDYFARHKPIPGGYYVRYEDGYESFSPAQAFESGYTRIN